MRTCWLPDPIISTITALGPVIVARCRHCRTRLARKPHEFTWTHSDGVMPGIR